MNKKFINVLLSATLVTAASACFTGCKDYDDDIDNLQQQINTIKTTIEGLQQKIDSGSVITNVTSTNDGINITLSDGKTYTITNGKNGADGKDGQDGAPGTAWTIGEDGYWYKDGVKTEYRALGIQGPAGETGPQGPQGPQGDKGEPGTPGETGPQGPQGPQGNPGTNGTDGKDGQPGKYYVPNEDGYFWVTEYVWAATSNSWIQQNAEKTNIKWRNDGAVTAAYSGNALKLSWIDPDTQEPVYQEIKIGTPLGSIEFVPSVVADEFPTYPTTDEPFYVLTKYIDKATWKPQDFYLSNTVDFVYRLNPNDAYVPDGNWVASILNRQISSRAQGDEYGKFNVVKATAANGEAVITASIATPNRGAKADAQWGTTVVALNIQVGQDKVITTSDYVYVQEPEVINPIIVNKNESLLQEKAVTFYGIYSAPADKEDDAFVKKYVSLKDVENVTLAYNANPLDLNTLPGMFVTDKPIVTFLEDLNFTGIHYIFEKPDSYLGNDNQHTNQQDFVSLSEDGILSVVAKEGTAAIGRTPVIRVNAYIGDKLLGSSYIKFKITPGEVKTPIVETAPDVTFNYNELSAALSDPKYLFTWKQLNEILYTRTGLTSTTFWNYYGGANNDFDIKVNAYSSADEFTTVLGAKVGDKTSNNKESFMLNGSTTTLPTYGNSWGIRVTGALGNEGTQTSNVKVELTNTVKTQTYYHPAYDAQRGAKYEVVVTLVSDDQYAAPNITLKMPFYVKETCEDLPFSEYFYDKANNYAIGRGELVNGVWSYYSNLEEIFDTFDGKDFFDGFQKWNPNATEVKVGIIDTKKDGKWIYPDNEFFAYDDDTHKLTLNKAMEGASMIATMYMTVTLANDLTCDYTFRVKFNNPFAVVNPTSKLVLDGTVMNEVETVNISSKINMTAVKDQKAILSFDAENNKLVFGTDAKSYGVTGFAPAGNVTITYDWDKEEDSYKSFMQLVKDGVVTLTEAPDAVGNWNVTFSTSNVLVKTVTLHKNVVVTVDKIGVYNIEVPVEFKGQN